MSEHINISTENRVTTVTINRPEKKNAITQAMYGAMADAIVAYGSDEAARALLITGTADMFTAGNDLADFAMGSREDEVPPVGRFLQAIKDCEKPLVAAVNGGAIGVGLTMLLHCDLVFAAESATFSAPFVSLGLVPEAASSMLLPAAVGMAVANDIIMTGRRLSSQEALQFGLVSRIYPDTDLMNEASSAAAQLASGAPHAHVKSKALIRYHRDQVTKQMAEESVLFVEQLQSPEFAEVVAAKMQKRAPVFE